MFDTPDQIAAQAIPIHQQIASKAMPIANLTRMTEAERAIIAQWVESGAPK